MGHIERGQALIEGIKGTGSALGDIARAGYRVTSKVLDPAAVPGKASATSRGLRHLGDYALERPRLLQAGVTAAALAPTLMGAFDSSQKKQEAALMNAYTTPDQTHIASLDEFLEKKAELYTLAKEAAKAPGGWTPAMQSYMKGIAQTAAKATAKGMRSKAPKAPGFWEASGHNVVEGIGKGIGSSVGDALVGLAAHGIGTGIDALRDHFMVDPKRKALVETLLRTDPVLSDAVARHPDSITAVKEAYGTMVRFAPTLSLDINAVRSFLREAVLGGAGVNYATIKNLVETERSISDAKPNYLFGGH